MELVTIEIEAGLDSIQDSNETDNLIEAREISSQCKCLPACTSIEYAAETSQAYYEWQALFTAWKMNLSDPDFQEFVYFLNFST